MSQADVLEWMRGNLGVMDRAVIDRHLMSAFSELCKVRGVSLRKQTIAKRPMLRAERGDLQIDSVVIDKIV